MRTGLMRLRTLLFLASLIAFPSTARADYFLVPFAGVKFGGSTSIVDLELAAGTTKLVLGVAGLKLDNGILGYEVEFGHISGYFGNDDLALAQPVVKPGSYVTDLTGSIVLALPPGVTGGGLAALCGDRRRIDSRRGGGHRRSLAGAPHRAGDQSRGWCDRTADARRSACASTSVTCAACRRMRRSAWSADALPIRDLRSACCCGSKRGPRTRASRCGPSPFRLP